MSAWIVKPPAIEKTWDACTQTVEYNGSGIQPIAISPDGGWIAWASFKTIGIWDVTIGACTQTLEGHRQRISSMAISPDSRWIVSGSDDTTIKIWNVATGACAKTCNGHSDRITSVAISPDSRLIASGSGDTTIKIWEVATGDCTKTCNGHSDRITSVVISSNSRWLVSGSKDNTIKIWGVAEGTCSQTFDSYSDSIESVVMSPDGRWLAIGVRDGTIQVWDLAKRVRQKTIGDNFTWEKPMAISLDGCWLASIRAYSTGDGHGNAITIWKIETGACVQTLRGHQREIGPITISPNSRWLASRSYDGTIKIWDIAEEAYEEPPEGLGYDVSIAVSPNGRRLALKSGDQAINIWDVTEGIHLQTLDGQHALMVMLSDGRRLASVSGKTRNAIDIWNVETGACIQTLQTRDDVICFIAIAPNGCWLASKSGHRRIKIWDVITGICTQTFKCREAGRDLIVISPDSCWLASLSGESARSRPRGQKNGIYIEIWDVATGAGKRMTAADHDDGISSIVILPGTHWLVWVEYTTVEVWDVASDTRKQPLQGPASPILTVSGSPNGRRLASISADSTIRIWDVATAPCTHNFTARPRFRGIHLGTPLSSKISVAFDSDTRLRTTFGAIDLGPAAYPNTPAQTSGALPPAMVEALPDYRGYGIHKTMKWIAWNGQEVMWLPPRYRPCAFAVIDATIVIGCTSGSCLVFNFQQQTNSMCI